MAWYDDPLTVIAVAVVIIARLRYSYFCHETAGKKTSAAKEKPQKTVNDPSLEYSGLPFKISKSVQTTTASNAKDELRMLDLETGDFRRCIASFV